MIGAPKDGTYIDVTLRTPPFAIRMTPMGEVIDTKDNVEKPDLNTRIVREWATALASQPMMMAHGNEGMAGFERLVLRLVKFHETGSFE